MILITSKGARLLISMILGGGLSTLLFNTGNPNRTQGTLDYILPVICMVVMYQLFTFLVNRNKQKPF